MIFVRVGSKLFKSWYWIDVKQETKLNVVFGLYSYWLPIDKILISRIHVIDFIVAGPYNGRDSGEFISVPIVNLHD